jgi:hypothetical protein
VLTEGEIVRGVHTPEHLGYRRQGRWLWLKKGGWRSSSAPPCSSTATTSTCILPLIGAVKLARLSTPVQAFRDKLLKPARERSRKVLASLKSIVSGRAAWPRRRERRPAGHRRQKKREQAGSRSVSMFLGRGEPPPRCAGGGDRSSSPRCSPCASELRGLVWDAVDFEDSACVSAPISAAQSNPSGYALDLAFAIVPH